MGIDVDAPVFDVDEAIDYIAERSDIPEDVISRVLEMEEEYMEKIGIVIDLSDEL